MAISSISSSGLNANIARQSVSAHNTANKNTDAFAKQKVSQNTSSTGGVSTHVDTVSLSAEANEIAQANKGAQNNVDLAEETVQQIQSRENFKQNAPVTRTQDDMQKALLDLTA